jgi:hypothetical protein
MPLVMHTAWCPSTPPDPDTLADARRLAEVLHVGVLDQLVRYRPDEGHGEPGTEGLPDLASALNVGVLLVEVERLATHLKPLGEAAVVVRSTPYLRPEASHQVQVFGATQGRHSCLAAERGRTAGHALARVAVVLAHRLEGGA